MTHVQIDTYVSKRLANRNILQHGDSDIAGINPPNFSPSQTPSGNVCGDGTVTHRCDTMCKYGHSRKEGNPITP